MRLKFCYVCDKDLFGQRPGYWHCTCERCEPIQAKDIKPVPKTVFAEIRHLNIVDQFKPVSRVNDGYFSGMMLTLGSFRAIPEKERPDWDTHYNRVAQALQRMFRIGRIRRVSRGVYFYVTALKQDQC